MDVEIAVRVLYMLGEAMSVRLQALDDFDIIITLYIIVFLVCSIFYLI